MKRVVISVLVGVVIVTGGVSLVRLRKRQLEAIRIEPVKAVPVETARVVRGVFRGERTYFGLIASNREATLRARIGGQVSRIVKREGDRVRRGDVLIELDGVPGDTRGSRSALEDTVRNLERSVTDLEQNVKNLETIYGRDRMLFEKQAISRQVMELSENRWRTARAELMNLRSQLADMRSRLAFFTVKAPFDAVVTGIPVNGGDVVMPSGPLVRLEDTDPCKVVVSVSSDDLVRLRPGTPVRLRSAGRELDAELSRVYPSAAPGGTGTVEIQLDRPPFGLPTGASVEAEIEVAHIADALVVPTGAVLRGVERAVVFVVKNGLIRTVPVQVTAESGTGTAVEGDLTAGEPVVVGSDSLLMRLSDGLAVDIRESVR